MKFTHLVGKRALGTAYSKDYCDWAESLLRQGVESENLAILVSLGLEKNPDSEEVETYFRKSLDDLGLALPSQQDGLRMYAIALCEQIVSGETEPGTGVSLLKKFYSGSNYQPVYRIWSDLSEDLEMVKHREECIFNSGLTHENAAAYISNIASQFIMLLKIDLPEDFFQLSACPACGHIGKCGYEVIEKPWMPEQLFRLIYERGQTRRAICQQCGRPFPNNMTDYEGRKQYFGGRR